MNVFHRDIKLENFVLRGPTAHTGMLLIDFGLAEQVHDVRRPVFDEVGTKAYHAPEVGSPASHHLDKADVWSLGMVLFALCHGRLPVRIMVENKRLAWFIEQQAAGVHACDALYSLPSMLSPLQVQHSGIRSVLDCMLRYDPSKRCTDYDTMLSLLRTPDFHLT